MIIRFAVNNIARDVLTAAEGGEEVGEIIADPFACIQCATNVEILDEGVVVIVVFKVCHHPTVDCFDLFFVSITTCTNFVSKFFVCVSHRVALPLRRYGVSGLRTKLYAVNIVTKIRPVIAKTQIFDSKQFLPVLTVPVMKYISSMTTQSIVITESNLRQYMK